MIVKDSQGKEVEISLYGRYADDIQIDEAYYVDSDVEVPEDEIDYIYDKYADSIYEEWFQNQIGRAESYYEGDR